MNLSSQVESILFVASKPLSVREIVKATQHKEDEIKNTLAELILKYNNSDSGIHILQIDDKFQMGTNSNNNDVVNLFVKQEAAGDLTKAQLETLTVVAYRGPITRPELEQIRGVNCALIIRNLLVRGLVEEKEDPSKLLPMYSLSFEALGYLGLKTVSELPDYNEIHSHEFIESLLKKHEE